jgi:hypothetical protein
LADERNDAQLGVTGAEARADAAYEKLKVRQAEALRLQHQIDAAGAEAKALARASQAEQTARRRRDLAKALRTQEELAVSAQKHADACGEAMRAMQDNGERIARLSGDPEAQRLFGSVGAIRLRIETAFFRAFEMRPVVLPQGSGLARPRFLDYTLPVKGEHHFWRREGSELVAITLVDKERDALDALPLAVLLFETEDDARTVRDRRDPSGRRLHVLPDGDLFHIVEGQLRGAAARAGGNIPDQAA